MAAAPITSSRPAPAGQDAGAVTDAPEAELRPTERPSKTRLKQASHDLQALGVELVALSDERLQALAMPERLLDALRQYKQTRSHEGRRRQMQYVGKLMRGVDVDPLRAAVTQVQLGQTRESLALHQAERWRAELIADDEALTRFAAEHRVDDLQHFRNVIRNARKDAALVPEKRSGRAFRELFQLIKQQEDA
jgi:ribosome-associated protein